MIALPFSFAGGRQTSTKRTYAVYRKYKYKASSQLLLLCIFITLLLLLLLLLLLVMMIMFLATFVTRVCSQVQPSEDIIRQYHHMQSTANDLSRDQKTSWSAIYTVSKNIPLFIVHIFAKY